MSHRGAHTFPTEPTLVVQHNDHPSDPNGKYGRFGFYLIQVPNHHALGLHSGRANKGKQNYVTQGCARTVDDAMQILRQLDAQGQSLHLVYGSQRPDAEHEGHDQQLTAASPDTRGGQHNGKVRSQSPGFQMVICLTVTHMFLGANAANQAGPSTERATCTEEKLRASFGPALDRREVLGRDIQLLERLPRMPRRQRLGRGGIADAIVKLLAHRWQDLPRLASHVSKDGRFHDFVLKHIDATADDDELKTTSKHAQLDCPKGLKSLCGEIKAAADSAIEFGPTGNGPVDRPAPKGPK